MNPAMMSSDCPPLSADMLLQVLHSAQDHTMEVRQPAEKVLEKWGALPEFPASLYAVMMNEGGGENERFLAAVCLKNCLSRWWSRRLDVGADAVMKTQFRSMIISQLDIHHKQIAKQIAVIIAKMARTDWPDHWPDLFPTLLMALEHGGALARSRSLLFLHQVIKELSAKVVGPVRKHLAQVSPEIFSILFRLYKTSHPIADHNAEAAFVELYITKISRRLLCYGFPRLDLSEEITSYLEFSLQSLQARTFLTFNEDNEAHQHVSKTSVKTAILINELHHALPLSFSKFLPAFLSQALQTLEHYAQAVVTNPSHSFQVHQEEIVIRSILFIINVLSCPQYRPGGKNKNSGQETSSSSKPLPTCTEVSELLNNIMSGDAIKHLTDITISALLPLQPVDLHEWADDAETFVHQEFNEEGLRIRPTAENLLTTMMQYNKQACSSSILAFLEQTSHQTIDAHTSITAMLQRESLYNAIGLCAYDLSEDLHFGAWFNSHLLSELSATNPLQHIIRRRVALMLGNWSDSLDEQQRDTAYKVLGTLLHDQDIAVRMSALDGMLRLVDDVGFYSEKFEVYLLDTVSSIFQILEHSSQVDSKLKGLNLLTTLLNSMSGKIQPVVQGILQAVPKLWEEAKQQHLMKGAVLVTITRLVQALGVEVEGIEEFVVSVISYSADVKQEHELYTLEDGLDLFLAFLRNLRSPRPSLLPLFANVVEVLQRDFEHLQVCLHITESFLLLFGQTFLHHNAELLGKMFNTVVGEVKDAGTLMYIEVIDILLFVNIHVGMNILEQSGVAYKLLSLTFSEDEGTLVRAALVALFCRVCAYNTQEFLSFLERGQTHCNFGSQHALHMFLDHCIARVDNLMLARKRRIVAVAALNMMVSRDLGILHRLPAILNLVNEVMLQERKDILLPCQAEAAPQGFGDILSKESGEYDFTGLEAHEQECESQRRREIEKRASLQDVHLGNLVQSQIQSLHALLGGEAYEKVMSEVDPDVVAQLSKFANQQ